MGFFYHWLSRRLDQCASAVPIRCRMPGVGGARFPVPRGVGDPGAVVAVTGGWRAAGRDGGGKGGTGGALALPRRPLLSVCVCSKMAEIGRAHV